MAKPNDNKKQQKLKTKKDKLLILEALNFKDTNIKGDIHFTVRNFNWKDAGRSIFLISIGALLTSLSFYYFISPGGLYTNGLSAFAQLIVKAIFLPYNNATNKDYYDQMIALYYYPVFFAMNIPLIIWGMFKIGLRFAIYTSIYMGLNIGILAILSLTPYIDNFRIFNDVSNPDNIAKAFVFATIGGLIYGVGLGLLFKAGGSSGGMDFVSTYISMKRKYSIANIIKNTNIIIVVIAVFIDGYFLQKNQDFIGIYFSQPFFLATILYINIGSFVMNRVYPKYMMMTVFIISNEIEKIRAIIYSNNYLRGGNTWSIKGLYSGTEKKMMMTTMSLLEYNFLKYKIQETDPNLVMISVPTRYMHGGNAGHFPTKNPVNVEKLNEFFESTSADEKE